MRSSSFSKKRILHLGVISFVIIMLILSALFIMYRYHVEGETNMPFIITKINIVSTAESDISQNDEGIWHADILQKNDVYFVIEKNSNYTEEDAIKRISFENFQVIKSNENMIINIYRPKTDTNTYIYSDEYKIENALEYFGGQSTNTETLQINNQGGLIGFSVTSSNLGEYIFSENERVPSDGTLLAKAGVNSEDINFQLSFDLIIETESGHQFKANIALDLPTGNILEDGVGTSEDSNLEDVIFKRI